MNFQINSVIEKVQFYIQQEGFIFLWFLIGGCYLFYKFFLKAISPKRHLNLKTRFNNTFVILFMSTIFSILHWLCFNQFQSNLFIKFSNFFAFTSLGFGAIAVIKMAQILAYLYLFFKNISQGIPRLIVNLFTVLFSMFVVSYLASEVFSIHVTAMLATSAVFSLVLGLAMQDTLGNLFSGVAMQIGQPFQIGDWVEITLDTKKWTGQIQEITWRATFLSSFSDEWIMIPNKAIAQSEITIFTNTQKVLRLSHLFRIDFNTDLELAKKIIHETILKIPEVLHDPEPRVLLIDTTESWINLKVFYSIKDFSMKYRVADQALSQILNELHKNKIKLATNQISIKNSSS